MARTAFSRGLRGRCLGSLAALVSALFSLLLPGSANAQSAELAYKLFDPGDWGWWGCDADESAAWMKSMYEGPRLPFTLSLHGMTMEQVEARSFHLSVTLGGREIWTKDMPGKDLTSTTRMFNGDRTKTEWGQRFRVQLRPGVELPTDYAESPRTFQFVVSLQSPSAQVTLEHSSHCNVKGAPKPSQPAQPPTPPPAEKEPELPPLPDYHIALETNKVTDAPFSGVVTGDGSRLRFQVALPAVKNVKATAQRGWFETEDGQRLQENVSLSGTTILFYHPPEYVDEQALTREIQLPAPSFPAQPGPWTHTWAAPETVRFEFVDARGQSQSRQGEILLVRPPVVFIHGFLGDANTWKGMAGALSARKFATRAEDYYGDDESGSANVRGQAMLLRRYLEDERARYAKAGLMMERVDLVTHSMGGLIGRYYVNGYSGYEGDVRKLIMIGTPNHGIVSYKRNVFGRIASMYEGMFGKGAHSGMKSDVYYTSALLAAMNQGEAAGAHLNPNVQYGNIFQRPHDQVTADHSAHLQGVETFAYNGQIYTHSSALGTPTIVDAPPTVAKVVEWLTSDIPEGGFTTLTAQVRAMDEPVIIRTPDFVGGASVMTERTATAAPASLAYTDRVRTGAGRAVVTWRLNGHPFAEVVIEPGSEIGLAGESPWRVSVMMFEGKARFRSFKSPGAEGEIETLLVPRDYGPETYDMAVTADLTTFGTEYAVSRDGSGWQVTVLDGRVQLESNAGPSTAPVVLNPSQAAVVRAGGQVAPVAQPAESWWAEGKAWAEAPSAQRPTEAGTTVPPRTDPPPVEVSGRPGATGGRTPADAYALDAYPADFATLAPRITDRANRGFTPVGLAVHGGQVHVLYLAGSVMPITDWRLDWFGDAQALQQGITARMNEGYLPNGLAWSEGRYYVLFVHAEFTGTAWQIVSSELDLQAVKRDIQPWLEKDYVPFDVTLANGKYLTLLVQITEERSGKWSLDGARLGDVRALIERQLGNGLVPWGLLVDEVANVLFIG